MAERPTYPKSGCCVPFCRRTSTRFADEWLCADHWRLVPRSQKTLRTALRRRFHKRWAKLSAQRDMLPLPSEVRTGAGLMLLQLERRWIRTENRIWERMKKAAIERSIGI